MKKALFLCTIALCTVFAFGQSYRLEKLARVDLNPVDAIATDGKVVFAGMGGMLNVYTIYNRDYPQLVATVDGHSSKIKSTIVSGERLYVLWEKEGLEIFDIADPYSPKLLGKFDGSQDSERMKAFSCMDIENDVVYLGGLNFIATVSVQDIANPTLIASLGLNGAPIKIDYDNLRIYAAAGNLGLGAFYTPNPASIGLIGSQGGIYTAVKAHNGIILYGRLDSPQPNEQRIFGPSLFNLPFPSPRVVTVRDDAVFAGGAFNFSTYKFINGKTTPELVWNLENMPTSDITILGDLVYLANSHRGLSVFDASDIEKPFEIGRVITSDVPTRGCFAGTKFFVAAGNSGVVPVDFASPEFPVVGKAFASDKLTGVWDIAYHDNALWVLGARAANAENVFIEKYDVNGKWLGEFPVARVNKLDAIGEIHFAKGICAVSLGYEGVAILDGAKLTKRHILRDGTAQFCDITIVDDILYASDYHGGYQAWQLVENGMPKFLSSLKTSSEGGNGIVSFGKYLLAADGPDGIAAIDASDPLKMRIVSKHESVWGTDIAIDDDYVYLSDGQGGLAVFDAHALPELKLIDKLEHSGYWTHVYVREGLIIGVDAYAGLYAYQMRSDELFSKTTARPTKSEIFDAYPNPFNPVTSISFDVTERTDVELKILDISGRTVTTLIKDVLPEGSYKLSWDGTDAPSGTYFAILTTPVSRSEKKLVLLK